MNGAWLRFEVGAGQLLWQLRLSDLAEDACQRELRAFLAVQRSAQFMKVSEAMTQAKTKIEWTDYTCLIFWEAARRSAQAATLLCRGA